MVAGAVSMAAGEWISVTAQVELFKGVLGDLRRIVREQPGVVIAGWRRCSGIAPLLPWFFIGGSTAAVLSIVATGAGGLVVGGVVAHSSGRSVLHGAVRQLLIILLAAAVTYYTGVLFDTTWHAGSRFGG